MVNLNVNHMTNALFITNDLAENDLRACIDVATLTNQDFSAKIEMGQICRKMTMQEKEEEKSNEFRAHFAFDLWILHLSSKGTSACLLYSKDE